MSKRSIQIATLLSALLAGLCSAAWAARARAHGGDVAQVLSIVATDAQGPTIIRLNEGLALRRPEGFRFVCPARWADDAVVPMQAIPDGPAVIGASSGLYLMRADGTVLAHPSPEARGRVIALAAVPGAVLALRAAAQRELLEIHADAVRVLWRGDDPWEDLAVGPDAVTLARVSDQRVYLLRLSLAGDVISELSAPLNTTFANVRLRALGSELYTVLITSSLTFQLGRVEPESWFALATAQNIAGPIEVDAGARLVALDGVLARLEADRARALNDTFTISCLGRLGELGYACVEGGVHKIEASGVGASLFALSALLEPELESVPEPERASCMLQWQRYTIDLLRAGIEPRKLDAGVSAVADAGTPDVADANSEPFRPDAASPAGQDAAHEAREPGAGPGPEPEPPASVDEQASAHNAAARSEPAATPEPALESEEVTPSPTKRARDSGCQLRAPRSAGRVHVLFALLVLLLLRPRGVALWRAARR